MACKVNIYIGIKLLYINMEELIISNCVREEQCVSVIYFFT